MSKEATKSSANPHPILRRDFKEIDRQEIPLGEFIQMGSPEPEPDTLKMSGMAGCHGPNGQSGSSFT
jgi:hypothetical protein